MMKYILYSLLLIIPTIFFAQSSKDKTLYLDSLFVKTTKDDYKYYMVVKDYEIKKEDYFITRYFLSGKTESKGISESRDSFLRKGEVNSYYENENIKSSIFFKDGHPTGKCIFWYENGIKKLEGEYVLSSENQESEQPNLKVINSWDKNNIQITINGNGNYEDDENIENVGSYSVSTSNGKIKNGFKDGIWIGSNINRKFTFSEIYENGKFISGESIDAKNEKHFYTAIRKLPEPQYGINNFRQYVAKNFRLPDVRGLVGKIFTTFIIDVNGKLINPTIIKGLRYDVDKEAIRVLSNYIDWIPAEHRGVKTRFKYSFPINIQASR